MCNAVRTRSRWELFSEAHGCLSFLVAVVSIVAFGVGLVAVLVLLRWLRLLDSVVIIWSAASIIGAIVVGWREYNRK